MTWTLKMAPLSFLLSTYLFVQNANADADGCTSNVMPGIGLGPPVYVAHKDVSTWEQCRDLCCTNDVCVAWTLLKAEKNCFLRNQLGQRVVQNENEISGITKANILPAPHRSKDLLFYIGILSAPKNRARVCFHGVAEGCFYNELYLLSSHKSVYRSFGPMHDSAAFPCFYLILLTARFGS